MFDTDVVGSSWVILFDTINVSIKPSTWVNRFFNRHWAALIWLSFGRLPEASFYQGFLVE